MCLPELTTQRPIILRVMPISSGAQRHVIRRRFPASKTREPAQYPQLTLRCRHDHTPAVGNRFHIGDHSRYYPRGLAYQMSRLLMTFASVNK